MVNPWPQTPQGQSIANPGTSLQNIHVNNIEISEVQLLFELLNVRGQRHFFSTHERIFLWKCQGFLDKKYLDLSGTRTPNLRIHAE